MCNCACRQYHSIPCGMEAWRPRARPCNNASCGRKPPLSYSHFTSRPIRTPLRVGSPCKIRLARVETQRHFAADVCKTQRNMQQMLARRCNAIEVAALALLPGEVHQHDRYRAPGQLQESRALGRSVFRHCLMESCYSKEGLRAGLSLDTYISRQRCAGSGAARRPIQLELLLASTVYRSPAGWYSPRYGHIGPDVFRTSASSATAPYRQRTLRIRWISRFSF